MNIIGQEKKQTKSLEPYKIYCPTCGHSMVIVKQEKALCSWCGHWVFKNKKDEFKYRLKEKLSKKN